MCCGSMPTREIRFRPRSPACGISVTKSRRFFPFYPAGPTAALTFRRIVSLFRSDCKVAVFTFHSGRFPRNSHPAPQSRWSASPFFPVPFFDLPSFLSTAQVPIVRNNPVPRWACGLFPRRQSSPRLPSPRLLSSPPSPCRFVSFERGIFTLLSLVNIFFGPFLPTLDPLVSYRIVMAFECNKLVLHPLRSTFPGFCERWGG